MNLSKDFPLLLREAREGAGYTMRQLGTAVNVDASQISRYEDGTAKPRADVFARLRLVLGSSLGSCQATQAEAGPKRFQDAWVKTALRSPPELHEQIHAAADKSGRTFNAELIHRLQLTFASETGAVTLDKPTAERLIAALQNHITK